MEEQVSKRDNGRKWGGVFLLGIGSVLLLDKLGFPFPFWFFKWPVTLIVLGLFLGLRHGFRGPGWIILIVIGSVFLFDIIAPGYDFKRYSAPIFFILFGLILIFRPKGGRPGNRIKWGSGCYSKNLPPQPQAAGETSHEAYDNKEDYIDSVAFFGSIRKVIVSKDFKGGEMVAIFGGNEIDFSQADVNGSAVLDVTQIFGGTKLLVPAHWEIRSEVVAVFGGIEDKRNAVPGTSSPSRTLILRGTSVFGGIQIRSY